MAFNFPSSPVADTVFTDAVSGMSYKWNGEAWKGLGGTTGATPPPASTYIFNLGLTLQADGTTVDLDSATDLLLGGLLEPPPDGQPYARQNTGGTITWVPATATNRPFVTRISPTVVGTADPAGTLTVTGVNFTAASKIRRGAVPLQTTFVNVNTLTAPYDPAVWGADTHIITVNTSGQSSLPFQFHVLTNPTITSISPASAAAGSAQLTLTITGTTFTTAAWAPTIVSFDGVDQPSINISSPTSLTVPITPPVAAAGIIQVQVRDGTVLATTPPRPFTAT